MYQFFISSVWLLICSKDKNSLVGGNANLLNIFPIILTGYVLLQRNVYTIFNRLFYSPSSQDVLDTTNSNSIQDACYI